jgi:hypothetical protein
LEGEREAGGQLGHDRAPRQPLVAGPGANRPRGTGRRAGPTGRVPLQSRRLRAARQRETPVPSHVDRLVRKMPRGRNRCPIGRRPGAVRGRARITRPSRLPCCRSTNGRRAA